MLGRTGCEVLHSARRALPPLSAPAAAPAQRFGIAPAAQTVGVALQGRRKAAVKKAFKRLDHLGRGFVLLEDALQTLSGATGLGSIALQELRLGLERAAAPGTDGRPVLSFSAFCSYYQGVSPGCAHDGDFEQLLEAQWGCTDVSDILAAMQRQFARVGLMYAFQDQLHGSVLADVGPDEFKACLRRAGMQTRPDDLQRLCGAFAAPGGGLRLQELKEQIVAPRPETPMQMQARDLVLPPVGAVPPAAPSLASARLPPDGRPGTAPGHHMQVATAPQPNGPAPSDADLDHMLEKMESELHHLRKKTNEATGAVGVQGPAAPSSMSSPGRIGQAAGQPAEQPLPEVDGPITDSDMDAALSRMEAHLHHIKAHKVPKPGAQPEPAPVAVDLPHWEHHKYGHHEVKAPEWKPEDKVTDVYGQQHAASDYHYNNYGAGPHGHHLAHYHLNDYGGLAHHSFQQQDFQRQQFGAGPHGHWVPHLHGLGTASHHGEHEYKQDEYQKDAYGKEGGTHSHWVPHLHGLGDLGARSGAAA